MFTQLLTLAAVATSLVVAKPFPDTPDGVQKPGEKCVVQWSADPTGTWKKAYVELMAGSNSEMQHITTLGIIDATNPQNTSFTYDCLAVKPASAIYFYQLTSPFAPIADTAWSTRWAIGDSEGNIVPPEHDTQPNGDKIAWGNGELVDPSLAVAAPTDVGSQVAGAAAASGSTSASGTVSGSSAPLSSVAGASSASQPSGFSTAVVPSSTAASVSGKTVSTKASQTSAASGAATSGAAGNSTNAAITMSRASTPLFALGAVAAFAAVAL